MIKNIDKHDKNLTLFTDIAVEKLNNYMISKSGIIYNKATKKYLKPIFHKNTKIFNVHLYESQYQLKHLLYITYINSEYDFDELTNVKSKFMINIKKTNDNLPYINFEVDDLELITKSEKIKMQSRNNRIINKYDNNKNFIKSYDNIEDIRKELDIKYNKYITLACGKNKHKLYNNYYFRYDEDDEIKNPNIIGLSEQNNVVEESKEEITHNIELKPEDWKQLNTNDDNNIYYINYEISNHGRFRNFNSKKILKPHVSGNYLYANINIYNPENNKKEVKKIRINILVAQYFLSKPAKYNGYDINELVVDHIDGNKKNNYFENLQYLTNAENIVKG